MEISCHENLSSFEPFFSNFRFQIMFFISRTRVIRHLQKVSIRMENNFTTLTVNASATIHTPEPTPTISKINVPSQKLIPSATENNSSASQDDYSASPNESSSSPKFTSPTSTMNQEEVDKFSSMAEDWWNPDGVCKPLHSMNRLRIPFIRDRLVGEITSDKPLSGLHILDVGCGGGIVSEQLARLGAQVTGVDASQSNINIAKLHRTRDPDTVGIEYICSTVEEFQTSSLRKFDAVVASKIIEHVNNPQLFIQSISLLLKDEGSVFLTTLNRSTRSWLLAILGAEYVLGLLPRGTHDWNKFIKPEELEGWLDAAGIGTRLVNGMVYVPGLNTWSWFPDNSVNYALHGKKYI
ncbi:uncharacterized protein LOC111706791 isoform X2 [Eurytemora carolleeae]|uniref:uncharacterized protein LOC111706791 isoform X2 n=1 Tax=Eurytemora carolleeae TaxID=1294199 RepID=UPI000C759DD0|nr:uncharacterized protein LOC111706791 isoform X2 [Eurytemora carolleeae]|eukprot:XP_023335498.1 uncharacterized protein LOC111706791 isoform X2 [Eurytemora affinis]